MSFPKLYHTCKISSSNVSRYWIVVSLEMWLSNFKNVFANCSGFSLTMASLVLASWVSNLEMKLKSSCAMTCDLIWIYWIKTTAILCNLYTYIYINIIKFATYCKYPCQFGFPWLRISWARCCKIEVASKTPYVSIPSGPSAHTSKHEYFFVEFWGFGNDNITFWGEKQNKL